MVAGPAGETAPPIVRFEIDPRNVPPVMNTWPPPVIAAPALTSTLPVRFSPKLLRSSDPPAVRVTDAATEFALKIGCRVAAGIVTVFAAVGAAPPLQLPAVDQSVDTAPVHVIAFVGAVPVM